MHTHTHIYKYTHTYMFMCVYMFMFTLMFVSRRLASLDIEAKVFPASEAGLELCMEARTEVNSYK